MDATSLSQLVGESGSGPAAIVLLLLLSMLSALQVRLGNTDGQRQRLEVPALPAPPLEPPPTPPPLAGPALPTRPRRRTSQPAAPADGKRTPTAGSRRTPLLLRPLGWAFRTLLSPVGLALAVRGRALRHKGWALTADAIRRSARRLAALRYT